MINYYRYVIFGLMCAAQLSIAIRYQFKYIKAFWKRRDKYPLKQLSPLMTMIQTIFFVVLQITLIIWMLISENKEECLQDKSNEVFQTIIAFIYLFSRGCCFAFAILKTFRIGQAYQNRLLESDQLLTKILQREEVLIIIGMIYGFIGFPVVTFLTTSLRFSFQLQCSLHVYEQNYFYTMINSLIEEMLALGLMYILQARHMGDKLYELTYNVLAIYMVWFAVTGILAKCKWGTEYIGYAIVFSFWLRAHVMFYYYTMKPVQLKEDNPNIYIKKQDVMDFKIITSQIWQNFYKDTKILNSFEKYLNILDDQGGLQMIYSKQTQVKFEECFLKTSQIKLYEGFIILRQIIPFEQNQVIIDKIADQFQYNKEVYESFPDPQEFFTHLSSHLEKVFSFYCQTKAFHTLMNFYDENQKFQQNLHCLGIPVLQFDILDQVRNQQQ